MLAIDDDTDVTRAVIGRAPMHSTPHCDHLPPAPEAGEYPGWVAALVEPQAEARAQAWLWHRARIRSWLPTMPSVRTRGGVRHAVVPIRIPMVRGYLFIPSCWWEHAIVLRAPGIHSFMLQAGWPVLIRDAAFAKLRDAEQKVNDPNYVDPTTGRRFAPGEQIRFVHGAWLGVLATVKAVDGQGHIVVEAGTIGRIIVPESQVELADEARSGKNAEPHGRGRSGRYGRRTWTSGAA